MRLRKFEKAYIAGIIDGEGCIHIQKQERKVMKKHWFQCKVSVGMTAWEIPFYLKSIYGGSVHEFYKNHPIHKSRFTWVLVRKDELKKFLRDIKPYLKLKKRQVEILLSLLSMKVVKKHYDNLNKNERDKFRKKDKLYMEIRTLNHRGKETYNIIN